MNDFQASAGIQGRQFAEQCCQLLTHYGYELHGRSLLSAIGVEIDCVARSPGETWSGSNSKAACKVNVLVFCGRTL